MREFRLGLMALACIVLTMFGGSVQARPPFVLFPSAVKVKVFGAPTAISLDVDKDGAVKARGFPLKDDGEATPVPVLDGGWLSASEIAALRGAVKLRRSPREMLACCSPRHAFLFYDRAGRFIGVFEVCFECGCTPFGPRPPGIDMSYIEWNRGVVRQIIEAHHLGPVKAEHR